jgi:hypothetical protein
MEEIFRLKCIACASRTKSRDWLGMYLLLSQGHFKPMDMYRTFELSGVVSKFDVAMARMTLGTISPQNEGFDTLMPKPPSVHEMQSFFRDMFAKLQTDVAAMKFQEHQRKQL